MTEPGADREQPPPDGTNVPLTRTLALTQRRGTLLIGGICSLALGLVAGLLTWMNSSSEYDTSTAKRNLKPFEQAVDDLAKAPGLRYRDTAIAGITERDITVTASGSQFGTTGSGNKEHDHDVLRIGGKTFTRWQVDPAPGKDVEPDTRTPSDWLAGFYGNSDILDEVLDQRPPPPKLAAQLSKALEELRDVPQPDATEQQQPLTLDGTPALGIDTSAGRLLITKQEPHRVLRLEPYDLSELAERFRNGGAPTEIPQVTTGPLADSNSEGMDLTPIVGDAVTTMFDTLEKQAKQLNNARETGITFTLDGSGDVNCGPAGCTANMTFTGEVTSAAKTRITDGKVTAVMSATFTIGGQPAGKCTSQRGTFPVIGNNVSGSLTCSNPGAGPVYTSVAATYKAQAEAQSRASGGMPIRYSIPLRANTLIDARALAVVEVKQLVARVRRERDTADCATPNSFPSSTQVLLADGSHKPIEQVKVGDMVLATDPVAGRTEAKPVIALISSQGDKNLVRITVDTDGPVGDKTGVIISTDHHPFWSADQHHWFTADQLTPGMRLRDVEGGKLEVLTIQEYRQRNQRVHNLSIDGIHTYYVGAGAANVLVHNATPCTVGVDALTDAQAKNFKRFASKLSKHKDSIEIIQYTSGNVKFEVRVPGRVPNSFAAYRKIVDAEGRTISVRKITVTPDGGVAHIKDKM